MEKKKGSSMIDFYLICSTFSVSSSRMNNSSFSNMSAHFNSNYIF